MQQYHLALDLLSEFAHRRPGFSGFLDRLAKGPKQENFHQGCIHQRGCHRVAATSCGFYSADIRDARGRDLRNLLGQRCDRSLSYFGSSLLLDVHRLADLAGSAS